MGSEMCIRDRSPASSAFKGVGCAPLRFDISSMPKAAALTGWLHFSICACRARTGIMLIFSAYRSALVSMRALSDRLCLAPSGVSPRGAKDCHQKRRAKSVLINFNQATPILELPLFNPGGGSQKAPCLAGGRTLPGSCFLRTDLKKHLAWQVDAPCLAAVC